MPDGRISQSKTDPMKRLMEIASAKSKADALDHGVMTLGGLIDALKLLPATMRVRLGPGYPVDPRSYRGYYERMAFDCGSDPVTAGELLAVCEDHLGGTMYGYKGGEFPIHRGTLLHGAHWGETGLEICGIELVDGEAVLQTQEEVW